MTSVNVKPANKIARDLVDSTQRVIVGRPQGVRLAVYGLMAGGNCLFEDVPGLAKTLLVKTIAQAAGLEFSRIQFTPDLLPADITGTYIYNMKTQTFTLRKGAVFAQIVLADELNRAPPKTQAALLEAMQEKQVTLEGTLNKLPSPFHVYATQNPIESEGVYILPEAQLDRFMLRVSMGYPSEEEEIEVLQRVESWDGAPPKVNRVASPSLIEGAQSIVRKVYLHGDLKRYLAQLVHSTRRDPRVQVGSSPRGGIAMMALAKAAAVYHGRDFVTTDDVKEIATSALSHRILMRPEANARGQSADDVVQDALNQLPVPKVPMVAAR
ncbi:MAG: MoxR family ATPase [Euryarchaeota archaeon]|nr:MoxR family ATPase [Euryarchaeota archaeon]